MKTKLTILILTFALSIRVFGQVNKYSIVLNKGIIDSVFIFGQWNESNEGETHLRYLGTLTTKDNRTFKIMTSCWLWGLSKRATNRILIFNDNNQYVGNYYLNTIQELPQRIENNILIFEIEKDDQKIRTEIDLNNGLPKCIYINEGDHSCFE